MKRDNGEDDDTDYFLGIKQTQPGVYESLTNHLSQEEKALIDEIFQQAEAKKMEHQAQLLAHANGN